MYTKEFSNNAKDTYVANNSGVNVTTVVNGELNVTQVEDSCEELACLGNMSLRQPDGSERQLELFEAIGAGAGAGALTELTVPGFVGEVKMSTFFWRCASHQIIGIIKVLLLGWHSCHSAALQIAVQ